MISWAVKESILAGGPGAGGTTRRPRPNLGGACGGQSVIVEDGQGGGTVDAREVKVLLHPQAHLPSSLCQGARAARGRPR